MSPRAKATLLGVLTLGLMPFMSGPGLSIVQVAAGLVLAFAFISWLITVLPFRVLLGLTRVLLSIAAVLSIVLGYTLWRHGESARYLPWGAGVCSFGVVCGLVALEPALRPERRRDLYGCACIGLAVMAFAGLLGLFEHVNFIGGFIAWPAVFASSARRRNSGGKFEPCGLEAWLKRRQLAERKEEPKNAETGQRLYSALRGRLVIALTKLASREMDPEVRYARLIALARRYSRVALGAKLAYSAAVAREDWSTANQIAQRTAEYGIAIGGPRPEVLSEVVQRLGPRWREILREDDLGALLSEGDSSPRAAMEAWRASDPDYARFETFFTAQREPSRGTLS